MQRSISLLITTMLISVTLLPAAARAQTIAVTVDSKISVANRVSPFDLAYLAYQGYLEDQGIPSNDQLLNAIALKTITAQEVIQAAVKAHRLPEQILSERGYRNNLEDQLQGLKED